MNRINIHPHDATINDLIIAVKRKQNNYHKIIVTMDGNEPFVNAKGGIVKLCKASQLYDPLTYRHDLPINISTYIRGGGGGGGETNRLHISFLKNT